jgi:hypothetical protein
LTSATAASLQSNAGLFTIHPNIGGVFESDKETHDHIKHPVTFRFQSLKPLRDLRESIYA